jgi:hypothetical protein
VRWRRGATPFNSVLDARASEEKEDEEEDVAVRASGVLSG